MGVTWPSVNGTVTLSYSSNLLECVVLSCVVIVMDSKSFITRELEALIAQKNASRRVSYKQCV